MLACRKTSNEGVGPRLVAFLPHVRKKGDKDADLAPHRQGFTTLVRLRTFVAGFGVARPEANPFLYGPAPMATERTLILVKPDAFERRLTGEVIARFERKGLHLVALKLMQADEEIANVHYAEHTDKPFFGELVEFITGGELVATRAGGAQRREGGPPGDRRDRSGRGGRRIDSRRVRHRGHLQSRAWLGLAGIG